jgi:hypothetical protein
MAYLVLLLRTRECNHDLRIPTDGAEARGNGVHNFLVDCPKLIPLHQIVTKKGGSGASGENIM